MPMIRCTKCRGEYPEYEMAVYTLSNQPLCDYCYNKTMEKLKGNPNAQDQADQKRRH
jgi:hypothetical protein